MPRKFEAGQEHMPVPVSLKTILLTLIAHFHSQLTPALRREIAKDYFI